ncbi:MAG: 50S ribosomal protein L25 [Solirubrobacterales bacterium]
MADRPNLTATPRGADQSGSPNARRLRNEGKVPGIVYSGGGDARPFVTEARELRNVLGAGQALFDLSIEGVDVVPVVLKERQTHPVRGHDIHIDLQEVRLDVKIQATVTLGTVGEDDAPGSKEGGIVDLVLNEVTVEALPTDIPERIEVDVSAMEIGDSINVEALAAPSGVEVMDDPEETVVSMAPPPEEEPEPELEEETGLVGEEGEEAAEGGEAAEGDEGGEGGGESSPEDS